MKTLRHLLTAVLFTLGLTGCLQIENVVKVQANGSGTVDVKVVMGKAALAQIEQMTAGFGDLGGGKKEDKPAAKAFDLMDETKLKETAGKMGEGVTFVSAKKIETETGSGFVATYAFKDINKLKLDQNPSDVMPTPGGKKGGPGGSKTEPVTFKFTQGSPATLLVKMPTPDMKAAAKKKEEATGMEDMAMQMMKRRCSRT